MKLTAMLLSLLASVGGLPGNALAAEAAQTVLKAGAHPAVQGDSAYFTGDVRIDPLLPATDWARYVAGQVTFEPGARTAWHVHPTGQQFIVTSGVGPDPAVGRSYRRDPRRRRRQLPARRQALARCKPHHRDDAYRAHRNSQWQKRGMAGKGQR